MAKKPETITAREDGLFVMPAGSPVRLAFIDWMADASSGPAHKVVRYEGRHIPSAGQITVVFRLSWHTLDALIVLGRALQQTEERVLGSILTAAKELELSEDHTWHCTNRGRPPQRLENSPNRLIQIGRDPRYVTTDGCTLQVFRDEMRDQKFDLTADEIAIVEAQAKTHKKSSSAIVEALVSWYLKDVLAPAARATLPEPVAYVDPSSRGRYGSKTYP